MSELLKDKRVLLGVTGSISAYKACDLAQRLKDEGAQVRVIMTPAAAKLVHPNTFAALTGQRVALEPWSAVETGVMEHIELARWAQLYVVAPCTAHTLGEFAHGLTGSLLSLVYLAYRGTVCIAPAMNTVMLEAAAVRRNLEALRQKGDVLLPTADGILACGEEGLGKLLDVASIVDFLKTAMAGKGPYPALAGKKVLIGLGHTREKWDDVRYISNRSSGKTGLAIARAFHLSGAQVEIVAGFTDGNDEQAGNPPLGFPGARVGSSEDFRREMLARQPGADVIVMAAAIADFVPKSPSNGKASGSKSLKNIELKQFPNILEEMGKRKLSKQILVGFALETENALPNAERKMRERRCDLMIVNNPLDSVKTGFGEDSVRACVLYAGSRATVGGKKPALAQWDKNALADALAKAVGAIAGRA